MSNKWPLLIVGFVVVSAVGFCSFVAMQPADFKVMRSATVNATPETVFAQVNDLHKWEAWSPWAKIDPEMKTTYSGPASGNGAAYTWAGNDEVGEGKMEISASHPNDRIAVDIEFIKPFAAKNVAEFTIKPDGDKTTVTWSMSGKNNFVAKAMCLFINMDKLVGSDFEKGLAQLKMVVEAPPKQ